MLWCHIDHPNLLPFYGVDQSTFGQDSPCLISPWMQGNIMKFLENKESDEAQIVKLVSIP